MTVDEQVEVGTRILFRVLFSVAVVFVLFLLRNVVLLVLLSFLTAAALVPVINMFQRWKWSRTTAVIVTYMSLLAVGVLLLSVFLPLIFSEVQQFLASWPQYFKDLDNFLNGVTDYANGLGLDFDKNDLTQNIDNNISLWLSQVVSTTLGFFRNIIHFVGYFFLALYLSLEERGIEKFFLVLTPKHYHTHALSIVHRMQGKVSQWLFGQMLLMIIAFCVYYIGLLLLGLPYALAIALFGGLMEILPYVGPILAAIPAVLVGLTSSPVLGFSAVAFYVIAHQLEAHIIAPQVMKHSAGLNPVVLIIAILVGLELGGALGVILSVPLTMILSVFVEDLFEKTQE